MPTPQKEKIIAVADQKIKDSAGFYLLSFSGLSVADMDGLRGEVLKAGGELAVIKNRLLKRALGEELSAKLADQLKGPTMVAYCAEDPIGPAQLLSKFADDHPGLALKAGYVEGRVVSGAEALKIAALPPRQYILAEALGTIQGPLSDFVGVLTAVIGELVYVVEAKLDKEGVEEKPQATPDSEESAEALVTPDATEAPAGEAEEAPAGEAEEPPAEAQETE